MKMHLRVVHARSWAVKLLALYLSVCEYLAAIRLLFILRYY
jgi:hypothetical protein